MAEACNMAGVIWYIRALPLRRIPCGLEVPGGELVDVTPPVDGERRILFVPDDRTVYKGVQVRNIRKPLAHGFDCFPTKSFHSPAFRLN